MRRFIKSFFAVSLFGIDLPYAVLMFSIAVLLPLQICLGIKIKNKLTKHLPVIFYSMVALYYFWLHLIGEHWDGTSYLVPALLNVYLLFVCCVGLWCSEKIKNKGIHSLTKFIVIVLIMALIFIAAPWIWNCYDYEDTYMLFLYMLLYPVFFGITGLLAGFDSVRFWPYPFIMTGLFLIGGWLMRFSGALDWLMIYLCVSFVMMLIGLLVGRYVRKRTAK